MLALLSILFLIHSAAAAPAAREAAPPSSMTVCAATTAAPEHAIWSSWDVCDRILSSIPLDKISASVYNRLSQNHVRLRRLFDPTLPNRSVMPAVLALDGDHAVEIRDRIGWPEALYITRRVVNSGAGSADVIKMLHHLIDVLGFLKVRDVLPGTVLRSGFRPKQMRDILNGVRSSNARSKVDSPHQLKHISIAAKSWPNAISGVPAGLQNYQQYFRNRQIQKASLFTTSSTQNLRKQPAKPQLIAVPSLPQSITDAVSRAINDAVVNRFFRQLTDLTATNLLSADGVQIPELIELIDQWRLDRNLTKQKDWRFQIVLALQHQIRQQGIAGPELRQDVRRCLSELWPELRAGVPRIRFVPYAGMLKFGYRVESDSDLAAAIQDSLQTELPPTLHEPLQSWLPEPSCRNYVDPQLVAELLLERLRVDALTDPEILLQLRLVGVAFNLSRYVRRIPPQLLNIARLVPLLDNGGGDAAFNVLLRMIRDNLIDGVVALSGSPDFSSNVNFTCYQKVFFIVFAHLIHDRNTEMFRALANFYHTTKCFGFSYRDRLAHRNLLHLAAQYDLLEIVEILLEHQPDLVLETDEGDRTPLEHAKSGSRTYDLIEANCLKTEMNDSKRKVSNVAHDLMRMYGIEKTGRSSTTEFLNFWMQTL